MTKKVTGEMRMKMTRPSTPPTPFLRPPANRERRG
jgi:hypothetical protein